MSRIVKGATEALDLYRKRDLRVIVCGGRDYDNEEQLRTVLNLIHLKQGIRHLWHGNARGADTLAHYWGNDNSEVSVHPTPADWKKHGKKAGPIRNQKMLGNGVDLVIAFPGGRGTDHMVSIARKAGVPVMSVSGVAS